MNTTTDTVTDQDNPTQWQLWISGVWLMVVLFVAGFCAGMYVMSPERPTAYIFLSITMAISAGARLLRLLSRRGAAS